MDKLQQVDWRGLVKTATQKVKKYTLNLTDLELKVEDATNAETWGEQAIWPRVTSTACPCSAKLPVLDAHKSF